MLHRLWLALALAGCTSPHWSVPALALDRVPLSVAELAPDDVWVVGGALGSGPAALMLHYDGSAWHQLDVGTTATLWWVHALSPRSIWAVGERGTIVRFDGTAFDAWAPPPTPTTATLYGVWGPSDDDLWVVGGEPDQSAVALRRDSAGWHDVTPAGLTGAFFKVWGTRSDDVYLCGQNGGLWHWDGATLAQIPTTIGRTPLFTVAGNGATDVYAVGGLGTATVLHFNGASWSLLAGAPFDQLPGLTGVSVDRDGTAFIVGAGGTKLRSKSGAWPKDWIDETAQATRVDLHAVSIRDGEVFAVGGNYQAPAPVARQGVIAHYGGDVSAELR
jgi:hypothetical protein